MNQGSQRASGVSYFHRRAWLNAQNLPTGVIFDRHFAVYGSQRDTFTEQAIADLNAERYASYVMSKYTAALIKA
ncbi:hypothetical protein HTT03_02785 [Sulfitobacter sp. S0837]|nr:hypothetical protein [Sulfitobacter maritimus]